MTEQLQLLGAGQAARADARHRARARLEERYAQLAAALRAAPSTRKELAVSTGMPVNTVNARIAEMRAFPAGDVRRVVTHGRRNGESICVLAETI